MTDKKPQPAQPQPPQLTDKQRVSQQVGVTDMTTTVQEVMSSMSPFGGTPRLFGKTDFEGHQLNDMIDLVENANPEHLTSAGHALFNARDAIRDAAKELKANIHVVHWEGESGDAFRTWGDKLVGNTHKLADFADVAAVQISAAGSGLASVSTAMPKRDHRAEPVKVADIPPAKRIAGNAEYEAAVAVEKDRQEAINQMNRLSSFYSVSEQTLAAQQPPVFEAMPKVGVPQPVPGYDLEPREPIQTDTGTRHSVDEPAAVRHSGERTAVQARSGAEGSPVHSADATLPSVNLPAGQAVGTELSSVITPHAPTTSPAVAPQTAPGSPTPAGGNGFLPPVGQFAPPIAGGSVRAVGPVGDGFRTPAQSVSGPAAAARGVTGSTGRTGAPEQGVARGGAASTGQMPMGRGVSGGSPRIGGAGSPRVGSTSPMAAGRGGGVVGGRPNTSPSASPTSRVAKGTVVGGEGTAGSSRSAGRSSQHGVVGAAGPASANAARSFSNADGVTGKPQGKSAGARASRNGFSRGGTGLVRGSGSDGSREPGQEEADQPHHRLTEDEESSLPTGQGQVPPAIN
ncbi:WXG100 family type VII secretion target [Streptomyces violascens]|uniref:WXG100 family type VII secretion target n=1 Tax=Streptomyces violascens TaxID=67381 RepID=UPI0036637817